MKIMLIKTILDKDNGRKWEIYKESDNTYSYKYFEYYASVGWWQISGEIGYTQAAIEWQFDIKIA